MDAKCSQMMIVSLGKLLRVRERQLFSQHILFEATTALQSAVSDLLNPNNEKDNREAQEFAMKPGAATVYINHSRYTLCSFC
ncbi:hypothetical protein P692DRAFT_201414388 [Suillus brevipes Sb2]|nr:hypothetical protein P692DRAFT_201414388 [Suillus brevipes Sb2]